VDPLAKAAGAILDEVMEKREGTGRHQWLAELAKWVEEVGLRGPLLRRVNRAWRMVQKLKAQAEADATRQMRHLLLRVKRGEGRMARRTVWSFGWYDLLASRVFASVGTPFIEYYSREESALGKVLMPLQLCAKSGIVLEKPSYAGQSHRYVKSRVKDRSDGFGLHDGRVIRKVMPACVDECRGNYCIEFARTAYLDGVIALQELDNAKWMIRGGGLGEKCEVRYFEGGDDIRDNIHTPAVSGDSVFTLFHSLRGEDSTLVALRRNDGTLLWRRQVRTGSRAYWAERCRLGVTRDGDAVVFCDGGGPGTLTRYSAPDGKRLWEVSVNTDSPSMAMTICRDSVVTLMSVPVDSSGPSSVRELSCFSACDGQLLWRVRDDQIAADAKLLGFGERAYVCDSCRLIALGPLGESLWAVKMPGAAEGAVQGVSVSATGVILVSLYRQAVHAFSPVNGDLLWTMRAKVESEVTVGARGIGCFCASDAVVAVDIRTGAEVWRSVRDEGDDLALDGKAPVALNERRILVRMKRGLQLVDAANGREAGWIEVPSAYWDDGHLIADNKRVFVIGKPEEEATRIFCLSYAGMRLRGPWPIKGHDGRASYCAHPESFTAEVLRETPGRNAKRT